MKLSAATGFNRAMFKIRWQSDRRHNRKMFLSQRNMNSSIKRKSAHCPDMSEWQGLDKKLTSHYLKMVEKEMEGAARFSYQVVKVEKVGDAVTTVTVAVFVRHPDATDDISEADDDGEDSADNREADEELGFDNDEEVAI